MIDSPGELLEMINSPGYSAPDQWQVQVQAQAQIQMKASVSVVAGCLDPEQIRAAHFEPAEDAGEAALQALASSGPGLDLVRASARSSDDPVHRPIDAMERLRTPLERRRVQSHQF